MTEAPESPETMSALSDGEADNVLSEAASAEDPDSPLVGDVQEQVREDGQMQEEVLEQEVLEQEVLEQEVLEQEVQAVSSGNQRPVQGALSIVQPEHTSPAQTSAFHPALRRRKKADPDFFY